MGSSLKGVGQFEIRRNDEDDDKPLDVIIGGDLSGESCIQVNVFSGKLDTASFYVLVP